MNRIVKIDSRQLGESIILGLAQILLWGGSFFLLSILAMPIMQETGWSHQLVYGSLSVSLLVSGLLAPQIGKLINLGNGDFILLYSGITMGAGLLLIGLSQQFLMFVSGWIVIGAAMGMGLYDALFATLGKKRGKNASRSIVQITLISGFAPTVSWFFVSLFINHYGWRNACFIYAVVLIVLIYPIHRFVFCTSAKTCEEITKSAFSANILDNIFYAKVFYLLLINFTISAVLMTGMSVYLIDILLNNHISTEKAISIAALLGPSQVSVRILDVFFRQKTPVRTAIISSIAILLGLTIIFLNPSTAFLGVILFGFGNGMRSILKGTLPLWIYGQESYATILGKLARLPLLAQAITPFIGGFVIHHFGIVAFLNLLCFLAVVNIIVILLLHRIT